MGKRTQKVRDPKKQGHTKIPGKNDRSVSIVKLKNNTKLHQWWRGTKEKTKGRALRKLSRKGNLVKVSAARAYGDYHPTYPGEKRGNIWLAAVEEEKKERGLKQWREKTRDGMQDILGPGRLTCWRFRPLVGYAEKVRRALGKGKKQSKGRMKKDLSESSPTHCNHEKNLCGG